MSTLKPNFKDVQAHYDLSNEFYALFLDPSMTYSCAYFEHEAMSLEEAQHAKIDLSLGKCNLPRRGESVGAAPLRLLDIGCGWGSTLLRAHERFNIHGIGLTLSEAQHELACQRAAGIEDLDFRLQGWEQFDEPVDRILTIGAFEHFRIERYDAFFSKFRRLLPDDGVLLVHSIVHGTSETRGGPYEMTHELVLFMKFISREIFPGGQVPPRHLILQAAARNGFALGREQSLRLHYHRTLTQWAANLRAHRDRAEALTSEEIVEKYLRYLTGCAAYFLSGHIDVCQFTLTPQAQ